jgi:hypothetical protein
VSIFWGEDQNPGADKTVQNLWTIFAYKKTLFFSMSLKELWKRNKDDLIEKNVRQVISFAGEGKLRDNSPASEEFRAYLAIIPSSLLQIYAYQCLEGDKEDNRKEGGYALQDIVNEIGGRLGFSVIHGVYQGTREKNGFDGHWQEAGGRSIVVEVKSSVTVNSSHLPRT